MRSPLLVLGGLAVTLAVLTAPSWLGLARGTRPAPPRLAPARAGEVCVAPAAEMRASHMRLLADWRDRVVRQGMRTTKGADGRTWRMSLTGTCLECHGDKAEFCDRCHAYVGVKPDCWNCHIVPTRPAPALAAFGAAGGASPAAVPLSPAEPRRAR